ncbi:Dehydrogenase reductase SDR member 13 [Tulasnella sp. JGI-2019a]|nr:Dehydrogenase reductase SDR member 13 [Tulasnella sp. JGI-2019a]
MAKFDFESTGDSVIEVLKEEVKGRTIAITGPSDGGIGGETARCLASGAPKRLILLSRKVSTIQPVIDDIASTHPSVSVVFIQCDLASQTSVRRAASEILNLADILHIDILINNAAILPGPYSKTEDGIESQFGVNHIGHFLLTNLLMPKILAAPKPNTRIVVVSSSAHRYATTLEDYNFSDGATYTEFDGYTRSKAANVLFTKALAERLKSRDVQVFSLHPGSIETGLKMQVSEEAMVIARRQAAEAAARDGTAHVRS